MNGPSKARCLSPWRPNTAITLKDIHFTYPGAQVPVLKALNLNIPARSIIGLVGTGTTGSGKTTTVDIILGLLSPQSGQLLVDGKPIFEASSTNDAPSVHRSSPNVQREGFCSSSGAPSSLPHAHSYLRSWQQALGYVPQHIYLADDTVAAKIAELHNFVTNDLHKGYHTLVGERGIRLSGGQLQRIGIARALYHDPDVLIFDEATSSLDNLTEKAVMKAIHNLGNAKTIILIAHRLTTVKDCDRIYVLEHGRVVNQGMYDELLISSEKFRNMSAVKQ